MIGDLKESKSRSATGSAKIDFTSSERKTKRLWLGRGLRKSMDDRVIIKSVDILLPPGTRLGILGPNGSGKTTLLRTITARPRRTTNDLDISSLEVLEDSLLDFPGALVLVTHDRYLIDRVSTSILALDGKGSAEYFADYTQWESNRPRVAARDSAPPPPKPRTKRLSYKDQREWDGMEAAVHTAEERLAAATAAAHYPVIAADATTLQQRFAEVTAAQAEVDRLYARWAGFEGTSTR